jgi:hypothetical protein
MPIQIIHMVEVVVRVRKMEELVKMSSLPRWF